MVLWRGMTDTGPWLVDKERWMMDDDEGRWMRGDGQWTRGDGRGAMGGGRRGNARGTIRSGQRTPDQGGSQPWRAKPIVMSKGAGATSLAMSMGVAQGGRTSWSCPLVGARYKGGQAPHLAGPPRGPVPNDQSWFRGAQTSKYRYQCCFYCWSSHSRFCLLELLRWLHKFNQNHWMNHHMKTNQTRLRTSSSNCSQAQ